MTSKVIFAAYTCLEQNDMKIARRANLFSCFTRYVLFDRGVLHPHKVYKILATR